MPLELSHVGSAAPCCARRLSAVESALCSAPVGAPASLRTSQGAGGIRRLCPSVVPTVVLHSAAHVGARAGVHATVLSHNPLPRANALAQRERWCTPCFASCFR